MSLTLERLQRGHANKFLAAVEKSASLHDQWVSPPSTLDGFLQLVEKYTGDRNISYVALHDEADLVGCISVNEIIRGAFQSAFLGFYAFVPFAGQGLMKQAMRMVVTEAFSVFGLHRLEANIQPANERSKRLVQSLGFRLEGFSPRYLNIADRWCDHERYAITAEQWPYQR